MSQWYKLEDKIPVPVDISTNPEELIEIEKDKRIYKTTLPDGRVVSTIFLCRDHSLGIGGTPILFETMLFPSDDNYMEEAMNQYHTWDEAVEGHWEMVIEYGGTKPINRDDCKIQLDEGLFTL